MVSISIFYVSVSLSDPSWARAAADPTGPTNNNLSCTARAVLQPFRASALISHSVPSCMWKLVKMALTGNQKFLISCRIDKRNEPHGGRGRGSSERETAMQKVSRAVRDARRADDRTSCKCLGVRIFRAGDHAGV